MKSSQQLVDEAKSRIVEVSVQELALALQDHKTILVDVREPDEVVQGYIDRSVNYPRGVLEMRIHQHPGIASHSDSQTALELLATKPIYLICRSGARSALAADSLQNMGFSTVYSVAGGFQAWSDAGYPVEL
ncbi:MAG: rhodanese-like domain-containing protein [Gammaproteobacteria bacterium]|nr:rhodanese-like domain-containing protein [Gammaproteobacteria bacterium]MBU2056454.1 rhodanese-like domain-containing protein [Gammaproteobacteria bacterium]MBU2173833.1 rhodanese-like domain-containing protein [Gammaproteobacteria bacterium]MBU2248896.1 rhodanese-like domain-containing protein [Gammaproteobacteria bacterium]MBU2344018.1 rhodanese-like domain-containing protein [Gammaproteobacteria bacterium]